MPKKSRTTLAVLGTWCLITLLGWLDSYWGINRALFGASSWNYVFHTLFFLVPLVWWARDRSRTRTYGLQRDGWRREWRFGSLLLALLFLPGLLADFLSGNLQLSSVAARRGVLDTLLYMTVFVAFAEELLFRGFFQGELNRAWGRPWSLRGTPFGMGLILSSLFFGIGHLLNPFNPLRGQWDLDWPYFAGTLLLGIGLGFVRERAGGLLMVTALHLGLILHVRLFVFTPYSGTAAIVSWLLAAVILGRWLLRKEKSS